MSDKQSNNPLHGVTLEAMLTELHAHYGWDGLASRIKVRCFSHDPSIKSSLAFLRRTPWARDKVEALFLQLKKPKRTLAPKPSSERTPAGQSATRAPTILFARKTPPTDEA
ncbi:VF530 family protein [Vogesella alkaliphila]|uniref:DUF2132 domain-containing protein n=1 Tax=Vogesella alkaliphila TaxID=1193621 RepID=A0ABQ2YV70_9NEIS|nr:VF530 family protein [Vogesella alkaliphila]GGX96311.1 hypothetical protein GCM10011290_25180 [Vogesella alkaliphila]